MHCNQTETRLQELLDSRQEVCCDDPALASHLEACAECAELAVAYDAMATARAQPMLPITGLADRVLDEVFVTPAPADRTLAVRWRSWGTMAVAASLLVAVGVAVRNGQQPVENNLPTAPTFASDANAAGAADPMLADAPVAANSHATERIVAGQDMWYRTGQGLASFTLASLRSHSTATTDASAEGPLFQRAVDTFRQMWPPQGESPTPNGETGWHYPASPIVVA